MKWLVTAFEPFGGGKTNSSQIILEFLMRHEGKDRMVFLPSVPVRFESAWTYVRQTLQSREDWAGVLAFGQAESRSRIGLERVALNLNDARMPDNAGFVPPLAAVVPSAPDMLWCNIPWEGFALSAICERSYSAGTYVCNNVMFQSLLWAMGLGKKAGFVHIPVLSSQKDLAFEKIPRLDDREAAIEAARIMEFVLSL